MIYYSPAKINLGLQILEKRADGFHNLSSVMYPVPLYDIIEIAQLPKQEKPVLFSQTGIGIDARPEDNLCLQAWKLFSDERPLPKVAIHLHKQIPVGAGLGGGSSNASTILNALNGLSGSPLPPGHLKQMAETLGSDCPFFLQTAPMLMEGRGELLSPVDMSLHSLHLVILFPHLHISTAEAYRGVTPRRPEIHLRQLIHAPIELWKEQVINDFEPSIFERFPKLESYKLALYRAGALYASLSGSGSSLYGIFESPPDLPAKIRKEVIWAGTL